MKEQKLLTAGNPESLLTQSVLGAAIEAIYAIKVYKIICSSLFEPVEFYLLMKDFIRCVRRINRHISDAAYAASRITKPVLYLPLP